MLRVRASVETSTGQETRSTFSALSSAPRLGPAPSPSTLFGTFPGRGFGISLDGRQARNPRRHLNYSKNFATPLLGNSWGVGDRGTTVAPGKVLLRNPKGTSRKACLENPEITNENLGIFCHFRLFSYQKRPDVHNFEDFILICTVFPHFGPFSGEFSGGGGGKTKFCGQELYGHPDFSFS